MRTKMFKIRNISSEEASKTTADNKRQVTTNLKDISQFEEGRGHFNELVDMFKFFLKSNSQTNKKSPVKIFDVQARDKEVVIDLPHMENQNGKVSESQLKRWTARVVKTVSSAAFHYFSKNEMSFEQAKIYCSENILRNIVILAQRSGLSAKEIQIIDTHIKTNVIDYLDAKYPLTESTEINKKLEEIVREVDNIESLDNNYFTHSDIVFEYREEGNYNDLIMRMINDLMSLVDRKVNPQKESGLTNFGNFQGFMTGVFEKVEDEDWIRLSDKEQGINQMKYANQMNSFQVSKPKFPDENPAEYKQGLRKHNEQKEKYRAKVKEYTSYLIGRKIPEDAQIYTEKEITNMNMTIKSPTILRILTKWCGELWQKYESGSYYSDRSESIKVQRGGNVNSLLAWMRVFLDERLRQEKEELKKYMEELAENNFDMQSKLLQREIQRKDSGDEHLEQLERIGGKFSLKVVKNLHSYIIAFLNRLIHGLLKASKRLYDYKGMGNVSAWPSPVNLLTFKVGDLMRCKCSSKEKEILKIYEQLQRISKQTPQKLRIVRIKNRLRTGTNDLLINVKFNNSVLCEIQLAVKARASDFIKCSNLFHHYFYELKRSHFGPLTQLCSIWSSLDRKSQIYQELLDADDLKTQHIDHTCKKLGKKHQMIKYERPFVCGQCTRTYFHDNFLRSHTRCNLCGFLLCAKCKLGEEGEASLIFSLITNPLLRKYCVRRVSEFEVLPKLGICVLIESKLPNAQIFTNIVEQDVKKQYIFGRKNGQIYEIQNMTNNKQLHKFLSKYIVFELNPSEQFPSISQYQAKKQYIIPTAIKKNYIKQKDSISLMDQSLTTEQCRSILSVGTSAQKETLKNLFLADNFLEELPFDPKEFPNLKWITLSRNPITNYTGLQKCYNLTNFIATSCRVEAIPTEIYSLKNLSKMSFSENAIKSVSNQIVSLQKLVYLQLKANALTALPQSLCQCQNISSIDIEKNQIISLPQNIYKLQKLQTLLCNENSIAKLPERIGQLNILKELNVSQNYSLSSFPDSFYNLQNLQILDASRTSFSCLPQQFGKLSSLKSIKFAHCSSLTHLPTSISKLKNLQKIDFRSCCQLQLPECLWEATSLKNINLSNCNINKLHKQFTNLKHLESLDLSGNPLGAMSSDLFGNFTKLIELTMEGIGLQVFPNLSNSRKLAKLNLKNNQIAKIPNQFIQNLAFLQELRLSSNRLQYFPRGIAQLSKLVILEAESNSIINIMKQSQLQEFKNSDTPIWPNLKQFLFSKNKFTEIPSILFKSLKLVNLVMESNQIQEIPSQIGSLSHLEYINLSYNKVKEIPKQFSQMKNLRKVFMLYNQVRVVPANLQKSTTINNFHLDGCPIQTIETPEWFVKNGIMCGKLYEIASRLVYEKDRIQKQNRSDFHKESKKELNEHDMDRSSANSSPSGKESGEKNEREAQNKIFEKQASIFEQNDG